MYIMYILFLLLIFLLPFHFNSHFGEKSDNIMQLCAPSVVFIKYSERARYNNWKKNNKILLPESFNEILGCQGLVGLLAHHL